MDYSTHRTSCLFIKDTLSWKLHEQKLEKGRTSTSYVAGNEVTDNEVMSCPTVSCFDDGLFSGRTNIDLLKFISHFSRRLASDDIKVRTFSGVHHKDRKTRWECVGLSNIRTIKVKSLFVCRRKVPRARLDILDLSNTEGSIVCFICFHSTMSTSNSGPENYSITKLD